MIGQADTLTSTVFDFSTTSTAYLQVDVSTSSPTCASGVESLSPRQQILSSGYAMSANSLGTYLKADMTNGRAQVGSGAGGATPIYFGLDVKNSADYVGQTCTTNGLMWYNSASSQALICSGLTIKAVGTAATTTIGAINANAGTPASLGTVQFNNGNNVTFGIAGNTITAIAGGAATLSAYQWPAGQSSLFGAYSEGFMSLVPMNIPQNLTATRAAVIGSVSIGTAAAGTTTGTLNISIGIYTRNGATLSLMSSGSQAFNVSNTSNASTGVYLGIRRFTVPININATPGDYWYAVWMRATSNAQTVSLIGGAATSGAYSGNFGVATNSSRTPMVGAGVYSNASFATAMPSTVAISNIDANVAGWERQPWVMFTNYDLN